MSDRRIHIDSSPLIRPLGIDDFIAKSVAVLGMTGSGKSNTAAVLAEEFLEAGLPFVIVDYAGEYYGLKEKYDIYSVGRSVRPETLDAHISPVSAAKCANRSYLNATSFILDVSGYETATRNEFLLFFLGELWQLSLQHRLPYMIIVEESQNFIPQQGKTEIAPILTTIATEGRKRGLGIVMVGQRAALINKNVLTQAQVYLLHKVFFDADLRVYRDLIPGWTPKETSRKIMSLKKGEAYLLWGDNVQRLQIRKRHTPHGGDAPTLDDLPAERGIDNVKDLYS